MAPLGAESSEWPTSSLQSETVCGDYLQSLRHLVSTLDLQNFHSIECRLYSLPRSVERAFMASRKPSNVDLDMEQNETSDKLQATCEGIERGLFPLANLI